MFYKMIDHQNKSAFKQGFIDLMVLIKTKKILNV